jgi:hypothetical protein
VDDEQGRENTDGPQRSKPLGFYLVLAAIVTIAVVYSVTMLTVGQKIQTPATAIAAMTATFTVIGTLVGTYFGIKAGLDGQDKVRETATRAIRGNAEQRQRGRSREIRGGAEQRRRERSRGADEGRRDRQRSQEHQRGARERRGRGRRDNEGQ